MSAPVRDDVAAFFDRFASAGDAADSVEAGKLFHPALLTLDPASAAQVTREQVVASLPRRKEFFARLGISGMTLDSLTESPIDERHTLVRSTWRLVRTEESAIAEGTIFTSTYLFRRVDGDWRMVLNLILQDLHSLASPWVERLRLCLGFCPGLRRRRVLGAWPPGFPRRSSRYAPSAPQSRPGDL